MPLLIRSDQKQSTFNIFNLSKYNRDMSSSYRHNWKLGHSCFIQNLTTSRKFTLINSSPTSHRLCITNSVLDMSWMCYDAWSWIKGKQSIGLGTKSKFAQKIVCLMSAGSRTKERIDNDLAKVEYFRQITRAIFLQQTK